MQVPTVFGIPNCDQIRKARAWFDAHAIAYAFHDFRKQGLERPTLERWIAAVGWQALLNRKGTTWRALDDTRKESVIDAASAAAAMLAAPTLIRRPVVEFGARIVVGFDADEYRRMLASPGA